MRRTFIVIFILIFTLALIQGCGSSGDNTRSEQSEVTNIEWGNQNLITYGKNETIAEVSTKEAIMADTATVDVTSAVINQDSQSAEGSKKLRINTSRAFEVCSKTHDTGAYYIRGVDRAHNALFAADFSGSLRLSTDGGSTWSANKTIPTDVTIDNIKKIIVFKGYVYILAQATSDSLPKLFRAQYVDGDTQYVWSSALKTGVAGSTGMAPNLNADASYIYFAEYGNPIGGPSLYRSADGETWNTIYNDNAARHIHSINADPYNAGHLWMCCGDGAAKSISRSVDYGDTWEVIANQAWQGVQISFTENEVFIAGDSGDGTVMYINKQELKVRWASTNWHANIAVPGGEVGDRFYTNAYMGAVDPGTGVYYCIAQDTSAKGSRYGFFYLPYIGGNVELIDPLMTPLGVNAEVFIANGYVWFGCNKHALLTLD